MLTIMTDIKQVQAALGYQANIKIGGNDPSKFVPNINCSFKRMAEDEFFMNINSHDVLIGDEKETLGEITSIRVADREERFYVNSDGTLEHEIVLAKKPLKNIIELKIRCSKELVFNPQNDAAIKEDFKNGFCQENAVNSYYVTCGKKHNEYQTGQVGLIYRSHVADTTGKESWCDQNINVVEGVGIWSITIPEEVWSDESLYPLLIGPKIGLETVGASNALMATGYVYAFRVGTMLEAGTLTKIALYDSDTDNVNCYMGVYDDDSNPDSLIYGSGALLFSPGSAEWHEHTGASGSLQSGEKPWVAITIQTSNTLRYFWNTGGTGELVFDAHTYGSLPATLGDNGGSSGRDYSAWIEYATDSGLLPIYRNEKRMTNHTNLRR